MSRHFGKKLFPLKCSHLISSSIVIACGLFVLISTLSSWQSVRDYDIFIEDYIKIPGIVCLIEASIIIAVGWLGIWVAYQEIRRGILMFCILICVLCISTIIGWIYFYYSIGSFENHTLDLLTDAINNYHFNKNDIDILQEKLDCCGIYNYEDWEERFQYVPRSCFKSTQASDYENKLQEINTRGCYSALNESMKWYIVASFVATVFIEGFFLLSIVLSYLLYRELNKEKMKTLSNQSDILQTVVNNPLAQASAPLQDISSSNFASPQNYLYHNERRTHDNFWTPRPYDQEVTPNRLETPSYTSMLRELDAMRHKENPRF